MSLFSGLAGLAGSLWSSSQNQNSANAAMAAQKEYQQSKHQWEVADLKKAGLNPILSANSAGGSVSGATYQTENPGQAAAQAVHSASAAKQAKTAAEMALRQQDNNDKIANANVANIEADTAKKFQEISESTHRIPTYASTIDYQGSSAAVNRETIFKIQAETKKMYQDISNLEEISKNLVQQRQNLIQELENAKTHQDKMRTEMALTANQNKLVDLKKEAESLGITAQELDNTYKEHGMSNAANKGYYHSSRVGKVLDYVGNAIGSINPLKGFISR